MLNFPWRKKERECPVPGMQVDEVEIEVAGLHMRLKRKLNLQTPHEVTAVIPRVEIRRKYYEQGELALEEEKLFNSITIVHAPRHPQAGESPPGGGEEEQDGDLPGGSSPGEGNAPRWNIFFNPAGLKNIRWKTD